MYGVPATGGVAAFPGIGFGFGIAIVVIVVILLFLFGLIWFLGTVL
ncbi:hypothetical protein [Anaerobacillus alkaliphilus]|nr:hypothetical protein [Anaerobacillus alkaliphilus]